jgi:amidase
MDALARNGRLSREEGINPVLAKENLDALVGPTGGSIWSIAAVAGYPCITVPLGLREKSATGMSFVGPAWSEPQLIRYAYAFEQKTKGRMVPRFLPTYTKP